MRAALIAFFVASTCARANADTPAAAPADAKEILHRLAIAENDSALAQFGTLRRTATSTTGSLTEIVDLHTGSDRSTSVILPDAAKAATVSP